MNSPNPSKGKRRSRRVSRRRQQHHAAGVPESPQPVPDHPLIPADDPQWIETDEALRELLDHVRDAGCFAYDTEFIGELSYYPKLCLIQIATTQRLAVVDGLCGLDLTPLWQLIADPAVRVLVHAGMQDLEPVVRHLDQSPANVTDTQVASGMIGLPYPAALGKLVEQLLGVRLGKSLTFTSWDERPISAGHLRYAADDVRYLPALVEAIDKQLDELGHADWARAECDVLCDASTYGFDAYRQLNRVRSGRSLNPKARMVLMELLKVRDQGAREHDLPPRTFLADEVLVDMARRPTRKKEKLADVRGMPKPVAAEYGQRFVEAIEQARSADKSQWPRTMSPSEKLDERIRIDALWATMQSYCMGRRIDPTLVTNRTEVARAYFAIVKHKKSPTGRLAEGWRGVLLGAFIERFLRGDASVRLHWREGRLAVARDDEGGAG